MFVEYLSDSKIRTGYSSTSVENIPPDLQGVLQPPSLTRHFTSSPNKTLPLKLIHTHVNEINDILIPNIESTRLAFATAYRMNAECTSPESRNGTVGAQCSGLVPRLESAHQWPSLLTQVPPPAMLEIMILQSETRGDPAGFIDECRVLTVVNGAPGAEGIGSVDLRVCGSWHTAYCGE
jgi:hypothetical protein